MKRLAEPTPRQGDADTRAASQAFTHIHTHVIIKEKIPSKTHTLADRMCVFCHVRAAYRQQYQRHIKAVVHEHRRPEVVAGYLEEYQAGTFTVRMGALVCMY